MANDSPAEIQLRLPSQLRWLGVVDAVVQGFAAEFALSADDVNNLSTAAIEAASNAMEHANKFDESKHVTLRLRGHGSVIDIEVEDEGPGFDPRPYERELTAEDLLKLRGRGIFIMRSFMDEVRFTRAARGGMCVHLRKVGHPSAGESGQPDATSSN